MKMTKNLEKMLTVIPVAVAISNIPIANSAIVDSMDVGSNTVEYTILNNSGITKDEIGFLDEYTDLADITVNDGDLNFIGSPGAYNLFEGDDVSNGDAWTVLLDFTNAINDSNSHLYNVDLTTLGIVNEANGLYTTTLGGTPSTFGIEYVDVTPTAVPVPGAVFLFGSSLLGLGAYRNSRK